MTTVGTDGARALAPVMLALYRAFREARESRVDSMMLTASWLVASWAVASGASRSASND